MGVVNSISFNKYPEQGDFLGKRVRVVYGYDKSRWHEGTIVRDDKEEPNRIIIHLDNGRYLLDTECQYQLL